MGDSQSPAISLTDEGDGSAQTEQVILRFNDSLNSHDISAVMALMTEDCVFENTSPAPDGERYEGRVAVRGVWERLIQNSPTAHFETEEIFATGDRCVVRWRYDWTADDGVPGYVRGVDVFRVRDGKVAEKLAYVKG